MSTRAPLGSKPMTVPVVVSPRVYVGIEFICDAKSSYEKSASSPRNSSGWNAKPPYRERMRSSFVIEPGFEISNAATIVAADVRSCRAGSCSPAAEAATPQEASWPQRGAEPRKAASAPSSEANEETSVSLAIPVASQAPPREEEEAWKETRDALGRPWS